MLALPFKADTCNHTWALELARAGAHVKCLDCGLRVEWVSGLDDCEPGRCHLPEGHGGPHERTSE